MSASSVLYVCTCAHYLPIIRSSHSASQTVVPSLIQSSGSISATKMPHVFRHNIDFGIDLETRVALDNGYACACMHACLLLIAHCIVLKSYGGLISSPPPTCREVPIQYINTYILYIHTCKHIKKMQILLPLGGHAHLAEPGCLCTKQALGAVQANSWRTG